MRHQGPTARVRLEARGGLEVGAVLATLVNHAIPGSETVSIADRSHRRLLDLGGEPTPVTLRLSAAGVEVQAPRQVLDEAAQIVTWWLDLDTDPAPVSDFLAADDRLAPLVAQRPALRPVRHPSGFEVAIDTVLGQQVSLAAARLFGQRLRTAYSPDPVDGLRPFPTAATLAGAPLEDLRAAVGLTRARAATVRALAGVFADGFTVSPATDRSAARATLLAVPGIGPWTVEYLALRALGDPDAFPASDAVVRRALEGAGAREATAAARAWRPWRAWATAHLWAGQV